MIIYDGIIYSLQKYGGISNYFYYLINNNKIIDSEVYLYGKPQLTNVLNTSVKQQESRYLERYRRIVDIPSNSLVHSSYYRISKNINTTNIITIYDFTYEKYNKKNIRSMPHILQKKYAVNHADAIICISENTKMDLISMYPNVDIEKIYVTYLAASSDFLNLNISFSERTKNPYVIFIGNRSGYKNFETVVKALELNKNVSLMIIGGGQLTSKENAILNQKLGKRYIHNGFVSNKELNILYNNALCLVYPSLYEGFGIPIIEAQSANCPVICNNISSIPEVAGDGAILLDNCTPRSIANSIDYLLESDNHSKILIKSLNNSARFSWNKTVSETIKIYSKHQI